MSSAKTRALSQEHRWHNHKPHGIHNNQVEEDLEGSDDARVDGDGDYTEEVSKEEETMTKAGKVKRESYGNSSTPKRGNSSTPKRRLDSSSRSLAPRESKALCADNSDCKYSNSKGKSRVVIKLPSSLTAGWPNIDPFLTMKAPGLQ